MVPDHPRMVSKHPRTFFQAPRHVSDNFRLTELISPKKNFESKNASKLTFWTFEAQKPPKNVILSQLGEFFSKNWLVL